MMIIRSEETKGKLRCVVSMDIEYQDIVMGGGDESMK